MSFLQDLKSSLVMRMVLILQFSSTFFPLATQKQLSSAVELNHGIMLAVGQFMLSIQRLLRVLGHFSLPRISQWQKLQISVS